MGQEMDFLKEIPQNGIQRQASSTARHKICIFCEERCCDMSTDKVLCELPCLHMKADTIPLFIYSQLRKSGVSDAVVIDAEDTDVVVLASYVAHQIEGPLGLKRKTISLIAQHSLTRTSFHFTSTLELMRFQVFMVMVNLQSLKVP